MRRDWAVNNRKKTGGKMAMYKKLYDSPRMTVEKCALSDIIVMSGTGYDSDEWDNSTSGGITL